MRRLLASTALAAALPGLAAAQDRPSLLDYFSVDVIVQRLVQSGIMALRTQLDLKYSDMSVDIRTGAITMTDVVAWPLPEWDDEGVCEIAIDRMTLRSGALDQPDRIRFKAQLTGTSFPAACLPPEPREPLAMAGLEGIEMPRMTIDVDYGLPGSDATMRIYAELTDVAAVDLTADFAYIWMDGREDMEEPLPVVFLDHAALTVENRGIWQALSGLVPGEFTGDGAGLVIEGALGQGLLELNEEAGEDAASLTDSQRAFVASAAEVWPAFLADPQVLVLETRIDGDAYVDFEAIEDDPRVLFDTLNPVLSLVPARAQDMVPVALLEQAMSDGITAMDPEDLRNVGEALITGFRAPRNLARGVEILSDLAQQGDGGAALLLSEALETRQPADAYRWALFAGQAGETGATARLDRLERVLGFGEVLALQAEVGGDAMPDTGELGSVAAIRERAAMRLSGRWMSRSYPEAAMWAMIASAAGDPEARDILADIDERVRLGGRAAAEAWASHEQSAGARAMETWIGQDLPARLTGAPEAETAAPAAPREGKRKSSGD